MKQFMDQAYPELPFNSTYPFNVVPDADLVLDGPTALRFLRELDNRTLWENPMRLAFVADRVTWANNFLEKR